MRVRVASPLPREVLWDFFFLSAFRESNTQRNRDGTTFRTLVVASDTTLCKYYLLALLFQSLCAFTSRVSLPREVLWDFFFLAVFCESNTQRNRDGTTFRTLVVASDTTLCKYYLLALLFQSLCAFTSRVSPAKRSPLGLLFFWRFSANRTRNAIATELHSVRLWLHLTRRFANTICSLCYFSRFALSRVASPLPREVLWDYFFWRFSRVERATLN